MILMSWRSPRPSCLRQNLLILGNGLLYLAELGGWLGVTAARAESGAKVDPMVHESVNRLRV